MTIREEIKRTFILLRRLPISFVCKMYFTQFINGKSLRLSKKMLDEVKTQ